MILCRLTSVYSIVHALLHKILGIRNSIFWIKKSQEYVSSNLILEAHLLPTNKYELSDLNFKLV